MPNDDLAFKRLFERPETIRELVESYAPEDARQIDFGTLRPLDRSTVGSRLGGVLVERRADLAWIASTQNGRGEVVVLAEFQGRSDWLMPLRVAVYQLLAIDQLFRSDQPPLDRGAEGKRHAAEQKRPTGPQRARRLRVISFVIHHGRDRWSAATSLGRLFARWTPGTFFLVTDDGPSDRSRKTDVTATVIRLERNQSVEGTQAALAELAASVRERNTAYKRFLLRCVTEMLVSSERLTREQAKEATTMGQMSTQYKRSLAEYGERIRAEATRQATKQAATEYQRSLAEYGERIRAEATRQATKQAATEARLELLRQIVGHRFGAAAAEALDSLTGEALSSDRLAAIVVAVVECSTAEECLGRIAALLAD